MIRACKIARHVFAPMACHVVSWHVLLSRLSCRVLLYPAMSCVCCPCHVVSVRVLLYAAMRCSPVSCLILLSHSKKGAYVEPSYMKHMRNPQNGTMIAKKTMDSKMQEEEGDFADFYKTGKVSGRRCGEGNVGEMLSDVFVCICGRILLMSLSCMSHVTPASRTPHRHRLVHSLRSQGRSDITQQVVRGGATSVGYLL